MISKLKKKISKRFGIILMKDFFLEIRIEKVQKYERINSETGV